MPLLPSGYARSTPSPVNSPSNPPPSTHPSSSATVPAQTADGQNLPSMNQFPSQHSRGRGRITQTADGSTIHEFSRAEFESLLEDANHQRLTSLGFSNPQKNFCRTACDYSSAIYGGTSSEALMEHLADHAQRLLELGFTQNEITGLRLPFTKLTPSMEKESPSIPLASFMVPLHFPPSARSSSQTHANSNPGPLFETFENSNKNRGEQSGQLIPAVFFLSLPSTPAPD